MAKYPKQRSAVTVTFDDGEVRTYQLSAGSTIAGYMMEQAAQTGILVLRDDDAGVAVCVPLARIRDVQFAPENTADATKE